MKSCLFVSFLLLVLSCSHNTKDRSLISVKSIEGNWEAHVSAKIGTNALYCHFYKDSLCHFGNNLNNKSRFYIENKNLIVMDENAGKSNFKVLECSKSKLVLKVLTVSSSNFQIGKGDTIRLKRLKDKNKAEIKELKFESRGCYGTCAQFRFVLDKNRKIVFEGQEFVSKKGYYFGEVDTQFMKLLTDKMNLIDLGRMKQTERVKVEDALSVKLMITTDKGVYSILTNPRWSEQSALDQLIFYILSNYESFDLKEIDSKNLFKESEGIKDPKLSSFFNKIPC